MILGGVLVAAAAVGWSTPPHALQRVIRAPSTLQHAMHTAKTSSALWLASARPPAERSGGTLMIAMGGDPANGYRVLGVQPGASLSELKAAYRERAKQCHPDVNPSMAAAEQFRILTEVSWDTGSSA